MSFCDVAFELSKVFPRVRFDYDIYDNYELIHFSYGSYRFVFKYNYFSTNFRYSFGCESLDGYSGRFIPFDVPDSNLLDTCIEYLNNCSNFPFECCYYIQDIFDFIS